MDIAKTCGYDDIIALLSGPTNRNRLNKCSCTEQQRILFRDRKFSPEEVTKLRVSGNTCLSQTLQAETQWQKQLEIAKAELVARYESRIADVEKQCRKKVAQIERACGERLKVANQRLRQLSGGDLDRVPSDPTLYHPHLPPVSPPPAFSRSWSM